MKFDKGDPTFEHRFAVGAKADIAIDAVRTWDPNLSRGVRLHVPVDVQALVVAGRNRIEHADIAVNTLDRIGKKGDGEPPADEARAAAPFTDLDFREPGVYLHWAMPDGLTQGTVSDGEEIAADQRTKGELQMRPLPDRWLVARLEQGIPRRMTAWVIESEKGRAVPLGQWPKDDLTDARTPDLPSDRLTAVAGGEGAWAAVFDNVQDRFAFHDDLGGRQGQDPLTYVVAGWYSNPDLDPLAPALQYSSLERIMDELGWNSAELNTLAEEKISQQQVQAQLGLESLLLAPGIATVQEEAQVANVPTALQHLFGTEVGQLSTKAIEVLQKPWFPQQCLFHGTVFGVNTQAGGQVETRPTPADVEFGIGATGAESLATLMAANRSSGSELAERLQTTFLFDLMDTFEQDDALAYLDEEVHRRGFESVPGGTTTEWVKRSDDLEPFRGAHRSTKATFKKNVPSSAIKSNQFQFRIGSFEEAIAERHRAERRKYGDERRARKESGIGEVEFEAVERPAPRFFYQQDPVVTLQGLHRSLRSGYDGRFSADETMECRLSGRAQTAYDGLITGRDLIASRLGHGGVPTDIDDFIEEAALKDDHARNDIATVAKQRNPHLPIASIRNRLHAETLLDRWAWVEGTDVAPLAAHSIAKGTAPSPIAITRWHQPWVPLYLEWKVSLGVDNPEDWGLGELDFVEPETARPLTATIRGRSLLNSAAAKAFAQAATDFISAENERDNATNSSGGLIDEDSELLLLHLAREAGKADRLNAALEGINEYLLGFDTNEATTLPQQDLVPEEDARDDLEVMPDRLPALLRGGHAALTRLRVVDGFGRTLELPVEKLLVAENLEAEASDDAEPSPLLALPPRLTALSRLWFRFVDTENRLSDATLDQRGELRSSPIAAWLLPDHVDHAVEIFSPGGDPIGQLRHESLDRDVVWEGAPGRPGTIGQPPTVADLGRHAAGFVRQIVARDAADRATSSGSEEAERESPLSALLRAIDTTLWTVDPYGSSGTEFPSMITGHPIAMVRARLTLDVRSDVEDFPDMSAEAKAARQAAFTEFSQRTFEVRLGALTRFEDGLLGYFIDDDYTLFHPVHDEVRKAAQPSGPNKGYLGPHGEKPDLDPVEIVSPYVVHDPTVEIHPGQTVYLTLLMAPGGKVHATSGIVPRKSIALPRDWVTEALELISPSFRIGPVLVDPTTVRMPRPTSLPKEQVWTRRQDPVTWRDDPILAATQDALLPDDSGGAQEGYIRVNLEAEDQ
ncbi:MAG: hypothetical protein U9N84_06595 [Actinomycetota bacterium]|nr:hypothetical protein [Actinomycetota bacterium]